MKILKGDFKGVDLAVPEGGIVRPTVDHLKKNILEMVISEIKPEIVWDLYAGSGGVGLEFLSIGASTLIFVEHWKRAVDCLKLNIAECGLKNPSSFSKKKYDIFLEPVEGFLKKNLKLSSPT